MTETLESLAKRAVEVMISDPDAEDAMERIGIIVDEVGIYHWTEFMEILNQLLKNYHKDEEKI